MDVFQQTYLLLMDGVDMKLRVFSTLTDSLVWLNMSEQRAEVEALRARLAQQAAG